LLSARFSLRSGRCRQNGRRGHAEQLSQHLQKDLAQHWRHLALATKEYVHHNRAGASTCGDHDHVKAVIGADKGDLIRGRGHVLGEQQEQHKERSEYVHAENHLSGRLRWQPEEDCSQTGEEETGHDEDVVVEAALASHLHVVGDVREELLAAFVLLFVALALGGDDVPLVGHEVEIGVHFGVAQELDVDRVAAVGPAAELHAAVLGVEGKLLDVDLTGGLEYAGRAPADLALVVHDRQD